MKGGGRGATRSNSGARVGSCIPACGPVFVEGGGRGAGCIPCRVLVRRMSDICTSPREKYGPFVILKGLNKGSDLAREDDLAREERTKSQP
jgi:hypothetical protein